jgi:hypothetical protein
MHRLDPETTPLVFASSKVRHTEHFKSYQVPVDTVAALLRETESQLRTTESRLQDAGNADKQPPVRGNEAQNGPIDVPPRLSDVTMREIRTHLGYNKSKWIALRVRHLHSLSVC